jgi:hypothetical protein
MLREAEHVTCRHIKENRGREMNSKFVAVY